MALDPNDIQKVKKVIKNEVGGQFDKRLGPKLEKADKLITERLDKRLGPRLEKVDALITERLDERLGPRLENVENLVKQIIAEDETLVRKDDIKNLPTKEEFFGKMDELMGEVKSFREEQTLLSHRVSLHSDQIEEIQKHLGIPTV